MLLTDSYVLSREERLGEEQSLFDADHHRAAEPPIARCFKCGWPIDTSKHFGSVWYFDRGTETIHVCRPTLNSVMALVRRDLEREGGS
jgi:hypothetical protein